MPMNEEKRRFQELFLDIVGKLASIEKKIYIFLGFILLLVVVLAGLDLINIRKIFAFILFVMIGGAFKYLISKYKLYLEFTPIVFFCVVIGHYMGIFWVALYILVADIMMEFWAGVGPSGGSVPWWLWMFVLTIIAKPFDILGAGMILIPLIYFIGSLAIDQFLRGGLNPWRVSSAIVNFMINLYFFIKLGEFFVGLIG